jgi:hypothetical protein
MILTNDKSISSMKTILSFILLTVTLSATAQDFDANLATARTSYASGKLEDARFAMQQLLVDIDIIQGKEIIKLLPVKLENLSMNSANDNVSAATGWAGALIHRDYGTETKRANLDIMSNSPLITGINAILSIPFVGNSGDGTQKVVKVHGYKSLLQKNVDSETNATSYTLQLPLNSSLITLMVDNTTESEILKLANAIPVPQIVKLIQ